MITYYARNLFISYKNIKNKVIIFLYVRVVNVFSRLILNNWLRGLDLNQGPSGYEPDELPDCSTPR